MGRCEPSSKSLQEVEDSPRGGCLFLLSVSLMVSVRSNTDAQQKDPKSALQSQFKASAPNHLLSLSVHLIHRLILSLEKQGPLPCFFPKAELDNIG